MKSSTKPTTDTAPRLSPWRAVLVPLDWLFEKLGVLPFLMVAALIIFSGLSDNFLSEQNLLNLLRQSVYLVLVALGQMLALISGGFDLSVGTALAITSVVSAQTMVQLGAEGGASGVVAVIASGCLAGLGAVALLGCINGIGVAYLGVSPFIMTMATQSIGFGVALYLTGGVPVSGLPMQFSDWLGFGSWLGIPVPLWVTIVVLGLFHVLLSRTRFGQNLYAVGGNARAAALSGIDTRRVLFITYLICALIVGVAGLLLTARLESGETNIGGTMALESIAACVIGGVSLRGGMGRLHNVVFGCLFIGLVQNGLNLAGVGSYLQMIVLGGLLVVAVVSDQFWLRRYFRIV
jgi:ribose transport system permease protein